MTVSSLCNDMLILAVFMLAGFFIREIFKPVQKLFLPSSLIGGLLLLSFFYTSSSPRDRQKNPIPASAFKKKKKKKV